MPISSLHDLWNIVTEECRSIITQTAFDCFIKDLNPVSFRDGEFTLSHHDEYAAGIIDQNYSPVIKKAIKSSLGIDTNVKIIYKDEEKEIENAEEFDKHAQKMK